MTKSVLIKTIVLITLFLLTFSALSASVVASKTLTIYGSISEKTTVSLDANGLPVLTSNTFGADIASTELSTDSYLFEVTAP